MLGGCERPRPDESVESLLANPVRLKEVSRLCREDRQQVSEHTCRNAALAQRERFRGSGETRYTPEAVDLFETPPGEAR